MTSQSENTKRIAKNTLVLYVRMLFSMLVSLYTSRVVLNTLGVEDYGIYNVVGGVIGMLNFMINSLGVASSRFITFELGNGDEGKLKSIFGNILYIYFFLAGLVLVFGETFGLWFATTQLQIPAGRETALLWVYQCTIASSLLAIMSSPYSAVIIAHERMSAFAFISITDVLLKLGIVILLTFIPYDKLIVYAWLLLSIQFFDLTIYFIYCIRNFKETQTTGCYNHQLFKKIFSFSVWTMNGHLAVWGYTQGLNILINLFFGPAVNAARGIAVQVQNVCQSFCGNFQTALNPQLTKSYARGDMSYMHSLLVRSSKFSFYILFFIVLPLMFEAPIVLKVWLGIVPEHTVSFLRLTLMIGLLYTLQNPIITSVHAVGDIKRFQLIEGFMLLSIIPIAYLLLKFWNVPPEYVFGVHLLVEVCTQYARLRIVLPMISMKPSDYVSMVLKPILLVIPLAVVIPALIYAFMEDGFARFFTICFACVICASSSILSLGCTYSERKFFQEKVCGVFPFFRGKS